MPQLDVADREQFLMHTAPLWEEMRGGRIFLTGGTGFIGCWLLESFLWANEHFGLGSSVTVLTRDPAAFLQKAPRVASHPSVRLHAGDVRTFVFPEGEFRYLVHAATDSNPASAAAAPLSTLDTIVEGTRRTLEFGRLSAVEKYLLLSSGAVYGVQPPALSHAPESYTGGPDSISAGSVYGQGKRMAELLCAVYSDAYPISCRIARCFAFAGPYLPASGHFAIGNFIWDAIHQRSIIVKGDGTPVRSYLYAMDLAVWLWTILLRGSPGKAYNVGSEHEVTIEQLAGEVSRLLSPESPVQISTIPVPEQKALRYVPSTRLAREELSLQEYTSRQDSILRTAAWYRQTLETGSQ